jgi:hypothetical protein
MIRRGGTIDSPQRWYAGTVELVELAEPESAVVDEGGWPGLGSSLPYTLSGTVKSTLGRGER